MQPSELDRKARSRVTDLPAGLDENTRGRRIDRKPAAWLTPETLEREAVRLVPLATAHAAAWAAQEDVDGFRFLSRPAPVTGDEAGYAGHIRRLLDEPLRVSWAIFVGGDFGGRISAIQVQPERRSLEVGTLVTPAFRGTSVNITAKLLVLDRYFGLGAVRVGFHVDSGNLRSQRALERLGVEREGVLRKGRPAGGTFRDDVLYGITDDDWPAVRSRITARLADLSA